MINVIVWTTWVTLVYAAYRDLWTRFVPVIIWAPLVVLGILSMDLKVVFSAAALICGFIFAIYLLYHYKLIGGADVIALSLIALFIPTLTPLVCGTIPLGFFPLAVLINTSLLVLVIFISLFIRNMVTNTQTQQRGFPPIKNASFLDSHGMQRIQFLPTLAIAFILSVLFGNPLAVVFGVS